jgi:hypothetical protein
MATTVNYTTLVQDIQVYLERGGSALTDPTVYAQIPRLINAAERKIMQFLKLQGEIEVLVNPTNGLQVNQPVVTKPDRWRETISINYATGPTLTSRKTLFPRSYEYCRSYWPDGTVIDSTQPPQYYADYDLNHWLIVPTPDQNYPTEFVCYMQPILLDSTNQSNFFSNYTPNMLLYGALLEAMPFLKDDPRIQTWQGMWDREAQSLAGQDLQKVIDRASQRKLP